MYCRVKFKEHLVNYPKSDDVDLPKPSGSSIHVWQLKVVIPTVLHAVLIISYPTLQENDGFIWKLKKLKKNKDLRPSLM